MEYVNCTKCSRFLPHTSEFFYRNRGKSLYRYCKDCKIKKSKEYEKNNPLGRMLKSIRQRCNNKNHNDYPRYGARGIECRLDSVEQIVKEIGLKPEGMTLDRIDVNGHYEIGNIRWASREIQSQNRTNTLSVNEVVDIRKLKASGTTLREIVDLYGISKGHVSDIVNRKIWKNI